MTIEPSEPIDGDYWLRRWDEGRIGFHQPRVLPLLEKHWPAVGAAAGSRVFVPLAGKSLDMLWFAAQGHPVLGVELSGKAVAAFLAENGLEAEVQATTQGVRHVVGPIELVHGDVFDLDAATLADCRAFYDRAALIALPSELRARYVAEVYGALPAGCRGLLITLEYVPEQKAGPPFAVDEVEVRRLFEPHWQVERLERRDILADEPRFAAEGMTELWTSVYHLCKVA